MSNIAALTPLAGLQLAAGAGALRRLAGLFVTFAVLGLIGLLVVPVAPGLLDVLLALNLAASITVLMVALHLREAAQLPSFPTILLLTTLFRLGLNVTSTRLILSKGDAGHIIETFGQLVVGGDPVIGAVIFLILTVIQFVVITKGAERVAEVSARFTLDGMPGKQMSIDADLRNGLISPEDARGRRSKLDSETRLYGALDGAMKFVKGDAIAGILISLINVIGGLIVGVFRDQLSAVEAFQTYSLLAIGDGLVSQIPALLVCTSAGIVVTRVTGKDENQVGSVGSDIVVQILDHPSAIACAAVMLALLAFVPGLPWPVFGGLAVLTAGTALARFVAGSALNMRARLKPPAGESQSEAETRGQTDTPWIAPYPVPVRVELGADLARLILPNVPLGEKPPRDSAFEKEVQSHIRESLGIRVPPIRLTTSKELPHEAYRVHLFETELGTWTFPYECVLICCKPRDAEQAGFDVRPFPLPWTGEVWSLVPETERQEVANAGFESVSPAGFVRDHVTRLLMEHSAEFFGVQETQRILDALEPSLPDLKAAVSPKPLSVPEVAAVLRGLLREQVPLRDIRAIFESLARCAAALKGQPVALVEAARRGLARSLCARCVRGGTLAYHVLASDIEELIHQGARLDVDAPVVVLREEDRRAILASVRARSAAAAERGRPTTLVVRHDLRPFMAALLDDLLTTITVLSDQELAAAKGCVVECAGTIRME